MPRWKITEHGVPHITAREMEVLTLYAHGLICKEIARQLEISPRTVDNLGTQVKQRIGARTMVHAVAIAMHAGLLQFDPDSVVVDG